MIYESLSLFLNVFGQPRTYALRQWLPGLASIATDLPALVRHSNHFLEYPFPPFEALYRFTLLRFRLLSTQTIFDEVRLGSYARERVIGIASDGPHSISFESCRSVRCPDLTFALIQFGLGSPSRRSRQHLPSVPTLLYPSEFSSIPHQSEVLSGALF